MKYPTGINYSYDPIHGYVPFRSEKIAADEVTERDLIDDPWLQRLRHIHQLQTAWWVFPSAEHTRFQHVLGVMHLGSRLIQQTYPSLASSCAELNESIPSEGYVECLTRLAGLLHDVGHGPFGHFFDDQFLSGFSLTHEKLGAHIIKNELGDFIQGIRRNPFSELKKSETLDPAQVAWLIQRPTGQSDDEAPTWLRFLRSLLSGIYTIDNMDFVLRDAYMSGYSQQAYDLERLIQYSLFTTQGLTIHDRGFDALLRFMTARAELFNAIYFHRSVRAIDLTLLELFRDSKDLLFPGNPLDHLREYLKFTESSLLVDVSRWRESKDPVKADLGVRWSDLLNRQIPWRMVCQRSIVYSEGESEQSSIFSSAEVVTSILRGKLNETANTVPLKVDIARHIYRPLTKGPALRQNFLFDSSQQRVRPLSDSQLFRHLPISRRICRVYTQSDQQHDAIISAALDELLGPGVVDDLTNM